MVSVQCDVTVTDTKTNKTWLTPEGAGVAAPNPRTAPSVSSITVARTTGASWIYDAAGYAYLDTVTVNGNALAKVEIHQLIKSSTSFQAWNGAQMTVAQIEQEETPPKSVDTGGKYVTDWDWTGLNNIKNGLGTSNNDEHTFNVTSRQVPIGGINYTEVRRASYALDFRIEARISGTTTVIATHDWGYGWNNSIADWTNKNNPPPPAGDVCASTNFGKTSSFTDVYGITGLPPQ